MEFPHPISSGAPLPFGASICPEGINFSIISSHATSLSLCLFKLTPTPLLEYTISLDPNTHRTGKVWHLFIHGLSSDYLYAYQVDNHPEFILDPYALEVFTTNVWKGNDNTYHPLGVIPPLTSFNWDNDQKPNIPINELILYEMHVRGFTQHPSSNAVSPGTFLGIVEKIPYLLDLGINAVELLPIFEFNECEYTKTNPVTKESLCNFWGYSTINFFAPMQRYASKSSLGAAIEEFKTMVKELHRHGIEVILDIVYNHTGEGGQNGPILSFKGLDNQVYYLLDNKHNYLNFSGCGNTFSCNHPITQELIQENLRYWATEMHVDGFRFDLTSILTRGMKGNPLAHPPIIEILSRDPILAQTKLIAEPWDAGGLYQLGHFSGQSEGRWSEWNGRYRDCVRSFIKGSGTSKGNFTTSICGSQDLYSKCKPSCSVNFIAVHDGFTLYDLVSYNQKHNLENGENNKDGTNDNRSWNCGIEGQTDNLPVSTLRARQMRNYHLALMISKGIPLIQMGDEYGHTKKGNNNTWCQNNELNYFIWDQLTQNSEFYNFYRNLIRFRKENPLLWQNVFLTNHDIVWHGARLFRPDWNHENFMIAFTLKDHANNDLYIAFNAGFAPIMIQLPPNAPNHRWYWIVNTANVPPDDFRDPGLVPVADEDRKFHMVPYSAILLKAQATLSIQRTRQ